MIKTNLLSYSRGCNKTKIILEQLMLLQTRLVKPRMRLKDLSLVWLIFTLNLDAIRLNFQWHMVVGARLQPSSSGYLPELEQECMQLNNIWWHWQLGREETLDLHIRKRRFPQGSKTTQDTKKYLVRPRNLVLAI